MVLKCVFIGFIALISVSNAWAKSSADTVKAGNESYRQGRYDDAIKSYQDALTQGGQENVARYNLGNAFYKKGESLENIDIDTAIEDIKQANEFYTQVMRKNPFDSDVKYNLKVIPKTIEALKKKKDEMKKKKGLGKGKNGDKGKEGDNKNDQQGDSKQDADGNKKNSQNSEQKDKDANDKGQSKDQQMKNEGDQGKESKEDKTKQPGKQGASSKGSEEKGDQKAFVKDQMTKEEAKDILEDYERNEEPKGLLNFIEKSKGNEQPVAKDW